VKPVASDVKKPRIGTFFEEASPSSHLAPEPQYETETLIRSHETSTYTPFRDAINHEMVRPLSSERSPTLPPYLPSMYSISEPLEWCESLLRNELDFNIERDIHGRPKYDEFGISIEFHGEISRL